MKMHFTLMNGFHRFGVQRSQENGGYRNKLLLGMKLVFSFINMALIIIITCTYSYLWLAYSVIRELVLSFCRLHI
jgi:hypothetical protein